MFNQVSKNFVYFMYIARVIFMDPSVFSRCTVSVSVESSLNFVYLSKIIPLENQYFCSQEGLSYKFINKGRWLDPKYKLKCTT